MARTDTLGNFLTDVADAIREKKGSSDTIQASDFDTEIANLPSGGNLSEYFNTEITQNVTASSNEGDGILGICVKKLAEPIVVSSNVTDLSLLFRNAYYLTEYPKIICGDSVTNMKNMYYTYYATNNVLSKPIDVSGLNTSNVTDMTGMFRNTKNISTIDFTNFNTSKVTNMSQMFSGCEFETLDLSSFASNVLTNTQNMFSGCTRLIHLDLRNFNFTTITTKTNMFGNSNATYVPANCEIIVADTTQKEWFNTNFSRLTNVKTVAEYEAE